MKESKYLVADAVRDALTSKNIDVVFCVAGGSIHVILERLDSSAKIRLVPCYNEQGAVYAAEGYARCSGKVGVVLVTSGPGLTNIITGINSCWVDSIPLLVLAGQVVERQRLIHIPGKMRQRGVQESDTHGLVNGITKASVTLNDASRFNVIFDELWHKCHSGRMGPCVLEIPVDVSYKQTSKYREQRIQASAGKLTLSNKILIDSRLWNSKHCLFILGNGLRNAEKKVVHRLISLLESKCIAYTSTWSAKDLVESYTCNSTLYLGSPGIFGHRTANAAMASADLIISLGSSLNYAHTGYRVENIDTSKILAIDIDVQQTKRPELEGSTWIIADVKDILLDLCEIVSKHNEQRGVDVQVIRSLNQSDSLQEHDSKIVLLLKELNLLAKSSNNLIFTTDMGTSFTATHSYLRCSGNRLFTAAGHAPMGWGLPGAIGACFGDSTKRVICITGDGGLAMNVQELMLMSQYKLNLALLVINNGGYSTIMATTKRYHGRHIASDKSSGVENPNFELLAMAYGIKFFTTNNPSDLGSILLSEGPIMIDYIADADAFIGPKLIPSTSIDNELLNMSPYSTVTTNISSTIFKSEQ